MFGPHAACAMANNFPELTTRAPLGNLDHLTVHFPHGRAVTANAKTTEPRIARTVRRAWRDHLSPARRHANPMLIA